MGISQHAGKAGNAALTEKARPTACAQSLTPDG
jgi:hypothetical protein